MKEKTNITITMTTALRDDLMALAQIPRFNTLNEYIRYVLAAHVDMVSTCKSKSAE